jgi:hypothetical protein
MVRLLSASACLLSTLLAAALSAQGQPPRCPDGEADSDGISVSMTVAAHPTRVANTLDSLLLSGGYVIYSAPSGEGAWEIAPRFTWPEAAESEEWAQGRHPGLLLMVGSEAKGDSTRVDIGARVLCRSASDAAAGGLPFLEMYSATQLAAGVTTSLDSLEAAGVDLAAEVDRPGFSLTAPEAVGEFRLAGREDFDDPRLGTSVRYARRDGFYFDVYVYPGVPADSSCPRACAEERVEEETDEFVDSFREFISRGYYRRMDVRSNERVDVPAGVPWRAGRRLVMEVVRGQGPTTPLESQYILYSFPGYMVKVRVTYPPSPETAETVRAFVAELLPALTRR